MSFSLAKNTTQQAEVDVVKATEICSKTLSSEYRELFLIFVVVSKLCGLEISKAAHFSCGSVPFCEYFTNKEA